MQDISIKYENCSPTESSERFIRDLMERLYEDAPSESHLKIAITKVSENGYSGVLHINSPRQSFSAILSARSPSLLAQQLTEKIRLQIDNWKSNRFSVGMRRMNYLKPNRHRRAQLIS